MFIRVQLINSFLQLLLPRLLPGPVTFTTVAYDVLILTRSSSLAKKKRVSSVDWFISIPGGIWRYLSFCIVSGSLNFYPCIHPRRSTTPYAYQTHYTTRVRSRPGNHWDGWMKCEAVHTSITDWIRHDTRETEAIRSTILLNFMSGCGIVVQSSLRPLIIRTFDCNFEYCHHNHLSPLFTAFAAVPSLNAIKTKQNIRQETRRNFFNYFSKLRIDTPFCSLIY